MTHISREAFINKEIAIWGEDYVFDLIDRGYTPVELEVNGNLKWWWRLDENLTDHSLTQTSFCATLSASRSVVSPVSTEMLTQVE